MSRKRQKRDIDEANKEAKLEQKKAKKIKVLTPLSDVTGDDFPSKWGRGDEIYRKIQEIDFIVPWKDDNDWMKNHKAKEKEIKLCELGKIVYDASRPVSGGKRRRKKRTRRRRKHKGGHAGNASLSNSQPSYTELAAMREANPQRVYYLYIINTNSDPPLVAPVGNGFTHEFKLNTNGDKIAITGHRVGHHNQNPAYTIPNPANNNTPPAIEVLNNFYNPAPGVSREFRDISDMMGNLQMGGRRKKSTRRRRKSRGKSRRRMRGKRKGKTRRKRKR